MWQDMRFAVRMLLKKPGFSLVAVVTLALGIGANTAVFTVVNAALLRGLPYRDPERLLHLWETTPKKEFPQREASYPDFLDWRQSQSFEGMAAYSGGGGMTLTGRGEPERLVTVNVTANFFKVLGVDPIAGRDFLPAEEQPGGPRAIMLNVSST
jgi:MacB-like periplasmic core domain